MSRRLTAQEREAFLAEEHAQGFARTELATPGPGFVLVSIRPDRWLSADFSEEAG